MKVKVVLQTNIYGSRCETEMEYPDDAFDGMTEAERDAAIEEDARGEIWNLGSWDWEIVED